MRTHLRLRLRSASLLRPIPLPFLLRRTYTTPPPKTPSRTATFYRTNTYPILRAFLLAMFTYQLAYYAWLKLEFVEEKREQGDVIRRLEGEVRRAVEGRGMGREDSGEGSGGKEGEGGEGEGKRRGWFGFGW